MTQKELERTLSREAAVQSARKREERRAELRSLGIDVDKVVEKRDLLEEAREEARRVREDEGGEESDEEYVDENEQDVGMGSGESGDESENQESGDDESGDDAMDEEREDSEMEDVEMEDVPRKRRTGVIQITSDDEDDEVIPATIPEQAEQLEIQPNDLSLTQFFVPTPMSGVTESQSVEPGTGLTQFFTSTALEDDTPATGEDSAHNRMDMLRQKAAEGTTEMGLETIGFPSISPSQIPLPSITSTNSPVRRRILKRRREPNAFDILLDKPSSEDFEKSRKEFIEDQAEESEDDYAAWRSGDESEGNMDGVVDGLIDDDTKMKKNTERQVARLYM
jgi:hypothetical protein